MVDRGKPDEALQLSDQALQIWNATSTPSNQGTAQAHAVHAYALAHLGRSREAADELASAVQVLADARGNDDIVVRRAQSWLKNLRPDPVRTARAAR